VLSGQRTRTAPANGVDSKLLRMLMEETNPEQAERDRNTISNKKLFVATNRK
jgi:hypothetical protein